MTSPHKRNLKEAKRIFSHKSYFEKHHDFQARHSPVAKSFISRFEFSKFRIFFQNSVILENVQLLRCDFNLIKVTCRATVALGRHHKCFNLIGWGSVRITTTLGISSYNPYSGISDFSQISSTGYDYAPIE